MSSFKRPLAILLLFGSVAAASSRFVGISTSHLSEPRVVARAEDPLPSWNDSPSKEAILDLVKRITDRESKEYVAPADRVATFDNDGTLWCEQPMYVELAFSFDRIKTLAPSHPEWKEKEPFKALLAGDLKAVMEMGERAMGSSPSSPTRIRRPTSSSPSPRIGSRPRGIPSITAPTPSASTSRCWNYWHSCARAASRLS